MRPPFFPDPYFGWTFYAVLVGITLAAAYVDLRKATLPKVLTLTAAALGLVFNVVRGAMMGAQGQQVWLWPTDSAWLGGLHGLLFALAGFGAAFVLFTFMWALGTCGGGDVKLFAALGAWVGWWYVIWIMLASVGVLLLLLIVRILTGGLNPLAVQKRLKSSAVIQGGPVEKGPGARGKWRMTYAFPVAVATAVVLLWVFKADLHLSTPKAPTTQKVDAHAD